MAYTLGGVTLPRPNAFYREYIEKSTKIVTLDNTTKKDITGRKERFILEYRLLTQAEVNSILSIFDILTVKAFVVDETNLTIASTNVHMEIERRAYNTPGNEYREDLTIYLEEVS